MTTVTFPIAANADDGECYIIQNQPWPPTSSGTFNQNSGATSSNIAKIGNFNGDTQSLAAVTLLRWDTSSIPDDATITGANLILDVLDRLTLETPELSVVADYYDFGGDTPVLADWVLEATPSVITVQAISGYPDSPGAIETVAFTDLSGINKSGYTGLRLSLDEAATPTQSNYIEVALREHTTRQEPRLEVTYTEATAVTGSASLGLVIDVESAGLRARKGAAAMTVTLGIAASAVRTLKGAAALSSVLGIVSAGIKSHRGSAVMSIAVNVASSGLRTLIGSASLPIVIGIVSTPELDWSLTAIDENTLVLTPLTDGSLALDQLPEGSLTLTVQEEQTT